MSDTKLAFYENFKKPIPPIYNTVIQELLVQQHLLRWNHTYQYDEVKMGLHMTCFSFLIAAVSANAVLNPFFISFQY